MKRFALFGMMLLAVAGMQAQNCEALLLPYFGSAARMAEYPADKVDWYCCFVRAAFYESDTVPATADLFSISEVQSVATGAHLSSEFVVDLSTLSYYAYNFREFQVRYPYGDKTLCFATPASAHPYLVLRSIDDMTELANREWETNHRQGR
ncbi:MAG: hypothetical protein J6V98_05190 [Bacteroidales bacterium]|nr:hypothetical protein [Bacteroidales bacterium]